MEAQAEQLGLFALDLAEPGPAGLRDGDEGV